jgi:hypothetical protein
MASKSSDDGHKSHQTPSLMPPLASVALEAVNLGAIWMDDAVRDRTMADERNLMVLRILMRAVGSHVS